jgi:enamine deaminase RidA (YjgF/YER057c/UK114 family)
MGGKMNSASKQLLGILCISTMLGACATANRSELVRYKIPDSTFPILQAVEVPSGYKTIYLSGAGPDVADKSKPPASMEAYGNTEIQTVNTLRKIEATLKRMNLSISDVIKMQVFLVGDPQMQGHLDFKGLMAGYTQFFGTAAQPNLPTRSAMQVAALANPGWLVEIEVVAVAKE